MLKGADFEVIDLGINVTASALFEAIKTHNTDILVMSALLTTTMPEMEETVRALKEAGIRDKVKVMAGGASVSHSFIDKIKADRFASDMASGGLCQGIKGLEPEKEAT